MDLSDVKYEGRALLIKPLLAILILACLSIGAFLWVSQHYINALFENVEKKYRQDLINIVSVAHHAVEPVLSQARSGKISREEAIRQVREIIRTMTYEDQDGKNYVFMSSYRGIMLVQPFEPSKELTNQWDLQDAQGLFIIRELAKAAQKHPNGSFVRYHYYLPGVHTMQEKLAYVVGLPELECYIGTGMYMARSISEQRALLTKVRHASLWLFLAVLLPISVSVIVILRRNRRLLAEIRIRQKAEEDLKISEDKYRSIFENAVKGIFQTSIDGRLISANQAFARICGYDSPHQMIAKGVTTSQYYADPGERTELLRLINEKGYVEDHEVQMKRKDGSLIWISISSRVVRDGKGNVLFYEGTIEDIHARRQAQEDVKTSRKMLNYILQAASDFAIISTDPQGIITVFNRGAERMLGYSADELLGKSTPLLFHLESEVQSRARELTEITGHRVEGFRVFAVIAESQGSKTHEWTYVHKDGSFISVSLASTVIRSDREEIIGYLGIASDITRRKNMERDVNRLASVVRHSSELINLADTDGNMIFLNEAGINMLGINPEDIAKTHIMQVIPDHLKPLMESEILPAVRRPGGYWEGELQYLNLKTNALKDVHAVTFSIADPDTEGHHYLANISLDISARKRVEEELRENEERLSAITANLPGVVYQFSATTQGDWQMTYASKHLTEVFGLPIDNMESLLPEFFAHVHDEDREKCLASVRKAVETCSPWDFEGKFVKPSGETIWYHGLSTPSRQGNRIVYNGILLDITKRKRAEEMLRLSEEKFAQVFILAPEMITITSLDVGLLADVNLGFEEITGWKREEVLGKNAAEIKFWANPEDRARMVRDLKDGKDVIQREFIFRRKDGSLRTGAYSARMIQINAVDSLIFVMQDITKRKETEKELQEKEERLSAITRNIPGSVFQLYAGTKDDYRLTYVSERLAEFLNLPSDSHTAFPAFLSHVYEEDREKLSSSIQNAIASGRPWNFEGRIIKPPNGVMWFQGLATPTRHENALIYNGIFLDISERKLLEEEHRRLEQQLVQSQKLDAIGQLASGVAHDFNNILMGIQGSAALMQMDYHPQHPHYQKLARIEEHVKRGANLTRQLLGFAREGKYEVRTISVNDLIRKVAQFFLETHKEIEADIQLPENIYPVEADTGQIEQVLLNMFINASHAMPKGGRLGIRTSNVILQQVDTAAFQLKPGDFVNISITDTGIGMDAVTLKRIFEPFFTTRPNEGGSGLGLASAYGIIRNHGGVIKVYSEPGTGTTFNIYLPSSRKKVDAEEAPRRQGLQTGSGGILLVDDEPMILGSASEMLKLLGYTVYEAASGREAAAIYAEQKSLINLVILDMIMPGISGAQTLNLLKDIDPDVQVILSSGYGMQGEVRKVMETGCRGFIQKPYSFVELSRVVHEVLAPEKPGSPG